MISCNLQGRYDKAQQSLRFKEDHDLGSFLGSKSVQANEHPVQPAVRSHADFRFGQHFVSVARNILVTALP